MTIYGKGCISNYRNCSLSYVWYSVLYRMLTFFRKSGFIRRYTIAQKDFERTYADCRISGEKGFASRLNNSLD